jgi:hypothetical protein
MLLTTFQTTRHHAPNPRCEKCYKYFDYVEIYGVKGVWLELFEGIDLSEVKNKCQTVMNTTKDIRNPKRLYFLAL